jgi:hypothetical protein
MRSKKTRVGPLDTLVTYTLSPSMTRTQVKSPRHCYLTKRAASSAAPCRREYAAS